MSQFKSEQKERGVQNEMEIITQILRYLLKENLSKTHLLTSDYNFHGRIYPCNNNLLKRVLHFYHSS